MARPTCPRRIASFVLVAVALAACSADLRGGSPPGTTPPGGVGGGGTPPVGPPIALGVDAACNPLSQGSCLTPWPSSIYEQADSTTATGRRLDLDGHAFPQSAANVLLDPTELNRRDGFSPVVQPFTIFPGGIDGSKLVGVHDAARSVTDDSPTVLVDVATGERVLHFAELDANADQADQQALLIRPLARLRPSGHYVVAVRHSLRRADGQPLATPPGFAAIVANRATDHERLERARAGLAESLAALAAAGVPASDLVVAWDFHTASDAALLSDLLEARDLTLAHVGDRRANVTYTVDADAPVGDGSVIRRKITGKFTAPLLLGDNGTGGLARDATGHVAFVKDDNWPFFALVPACASSAHPAPIIIYGHGFFGGISEADADYVQQTAATACAVIVGTEWVGMRTDDLAGAAIAVSQLGFLVHVGERIVQGMANFVALTQWARGTLATQLLSDGGSSIVDPAQMTFYGISQGAILGGTFFAVDPYLRRGALHIGAGGWGLLFERSTFWPLFRTPLALSYPSALEWLVAEAVLQMGYDDVDAAHAGAHLIADPLPGTPPKQVLLQQAADDSEVTNLASDLLARSAALPLLAPAVRTPLGLSPTAGPLPSGFTTWDERKSPPPPDSNIASTQDNGTHNDLRKRAAVVRQVVRFLHDGVIVDTCGGAPCDCSTGACD